MRGIKIVRPFVLVMVLLWAIYFPTYVESAETTVSLIVNNKVGHIVEECGALAVLRQKYQVKVYLTYDIGNQRIVIDRTLSFLKGANLSTLKGGTISSVKKTLSICFGISKEKISNVNKAVYLREEEGLKTLDVEPK